MCNLAVAKSALSNLCHLSEQVALVAVKLIVIEILNMKKIFSFVMIASLALFVACGDSKKGQAEQDTSDSLAVPVKEDLSCWTNKDSTIYGRADGFGQSAFTLLTSDGRELDIALTCDEEGEGHYGVIYGDREDTARYAVTTRNNDECLGVMINLSQLDKFIKGLYSIYNCRLVLCMENAHDTVDIVELNDRVFEAKGQGGKLYKYVNK